MGYVSSGRFHADLQELIGTTLPPMPSAEDNEQLASFPRELRDELQALHAVLRLEGVPELCVLTPGDLYPVPALTGESRDVVLEDWFGGDEAATDFAMTAVDIINGGGGFYIVVAPDGRMGLVCEDPYGFDPLACTLESFLRTLVVAHRTVCTQGVEAGKKVLAEVVDERTAKLLLTFAQRLAPKTS
jgi:hypothetical protein